jgi:alkylhydroperoxidase/carboxymuconolactone decarboxylase family protein YurZ
MASLTAAAASFMLQPDVPVAAEHVAGAIVPLLNDETAPEAAAILTEIREWSQSALGIQHIPGVWRALAHHPRLLEAVWRKNRLVLSAGVLDERTKAGAALAVAQFRQSNYWIAYQTQFLRVSCGFDDRSLVEATAMMMHSLSFNTVAHGMRLDAPMDNLAAADFAAGGRFENTPGPGRPPPKA